MAARPQRIFKITTGYGMIETNIVFWSLGPEGIKNSTVSDLLCNAALSVQVSVAPLHFKTQNTYEHYLSDFQVQKNFQDV